MSSQRSNRSGRTCQRIGHAYRCVRQGRAFRWLWLRRGRCIRCGKPPFAPVSFLQRAPTKGRTYTVRFGYDTVEGLSGFAWAKL